MHDSGFLLAGHHQTATGLFWSGHFLQARKHWEQSLPLYDREQHHSLALLQGNDPGVGALSISAQLLWMLGYPEQAFNRAQQAQQLARTIAYPTSLALALGVAGQLYELRREAQLVQDRAEALLHLATTHEMPYWMAFGTTLQGWALSQLGEHERGLRLLQEGMTALRATGAAILLPSFLPRLAEAYNQSNCPQEGLAVLAEALENVQRNNARWYESELYRLKGELTLQQENQKPVLSVVEGAKVKGQKSKIGIEAQGEAEACFLKAIEIAQHQQAKSWELCASTSLARLWQSQGKQHAARNMLAEVYNWFTEGFDTKDLQEAKALLEELA
jgi:predicted ATPase